MRAAALSLLLVVALALAGCDYPEAGFYDLVGLSEASKVVFSEPFMVEELISESNLTLAFNILLPRDGTLVVVELANSPDRSRRGWDLRIADRDTNGGDLQLEIVHIDEELRFSGVLRPRGYTQTAAFTGKDLQPLSGLSRPSDETEAGPVSFEQVPASIQPPVHRWQLRRISQARFEEVLGAEVAAAPRRDAAHLATLMPISQPQAAPTKSPAKPTPRVRPGRFKRDN